MTKNIFDNFINLDPFTKSLRSKFKIIDDCYKVLKRFYEEYPLTIRNFELKNRYQLGTEFLKNFSLQDLSESDILFANEVIYSEIGIEHVIQNIANFTGIKVKTESSTKDKKITVSIISESIFNLDLFEKKFTEFLKDVLMFQGIEYIFDLIVLNVNLEYEKILYNMIEYNNRIPCNIEEEISI